MNTSPFCTCTDTRCPNHPTQHGEGCSRCIRKCLSQGEIPGCFFNAIDAEHRPDDYKYADFARWAISHAKESSQAQ